MELIKPIVRVGNSAGVVLPREWLHGKARVILLEKGLHPEKEIFEVLKEYLTDVVALAIVGSYARGEESAESDVDVLAITRSFNKKIKIGKYEIVFVSEEALREQLESNALPLLPMLIEARAIINGELIERYKKTQLTKKNLSFHFETTKSAMKVIKAYIELAEEKKDLFLPDASSYSLILRLRSLYIIDCLLKKMRWSKKEFLRLIKKESGSLKAYEGYIRAKKDKPQDMLLPLQEGKKLYEYISSQIKRQERQWEKANTSEKR